MSVTPLDSAIVYLFTRGHQRYPGWRKAWRLAAGMAAAIGLLTVLAVGLCAAAGSAKASAPEARQKELEKMVQQAQRHLEATIKEEGFFSARVALNVWKSTALDAGLYDDAQYNDFRHRSYKRSVTANRRWFESYLQERNFQNAATCLEFWRLHSHELGVLDEEQYKALKERLQRARQGAPQ